MGLANGNADTDLVAGADGHSGHDPDTGTGWERIRYGGEAKRLRGGVWPCGQTWKTGADGLRSHPECSRDAGTDTGRAGRNRRATRQGGGEGAPGRLILDVVHQT